MELFQKLIMILTTIMNYSFFFKNSQNKIPLTFIKNSQSILNKIYCGDSIVKKKNTNEIAVFRGHKKVKVQTLIIKF